MSSYVCLQRVLVESSVHMGNDWFWRAVPPLTSVPSGAFGIEREWLIHVGPLMSRPCYLDARVLKNRLGHLFGAREALMCDETR